MSILYPVAANAEAALHAPRGVAARQRGAEDLAGGQVWFVTETVGPAFETEAAALDAYAGRVDDGRPGRMFALPPEKRWCEVKPFRAEDAPRRRKPINPVMKDGRRWPAPEAGAKPVWRLTVSYWRTTPLAPGAPLAPARRLRKHASGEALDARVLRALAEQPLQAVRPQQPLDIGLFETRLPENPSIVVPDE